MKRQRRWLYERVRGVGLVALITAGVCGAAVAIAALMMLVMT